MNIVFYSYTKSRYDHVNDHELKRFDHSIRSLREFNNEIPVYLFCDDPNFIPPYFSLEYNVRILPFEKQVNHGMLFIYRWFNLQYFEDGEGTYQDANILYVDSDTIFYGDVQYLFDHYNYAEVFGREEFGFRHDPNSGGGKNIRKALDYVDQCIVDAGGQDQIYKYCMGVMLFNDGIHLDIIDRLGELVELMFKLKDGKIPYPVPNPRIIDEYAMWVILSRIGVIGGLFGVQDVTQGYIEQKHEEFFNPIVLHYTTKGEQQLAQDEERFGNLLRDVDEYSEQIDPYHIL
tara:strand:- start:137 stop:1003 length:867 start_codon:yes stop_codon:yes gene_type:complete